MVQETGARRGEQPAPHARLAVAAAEAPQLVPGEVGSHREGGAAGGPVELSPWAGRVEGKRDDAAAGAGDACQLGQDRCGVDELQYYDGDRGVRDGVRQWQVPGVGAYESAGDALTQSVMVVGSDFTPENCST